MEENFTCLVGILLFILSIKKNYHVKIWFITAVKNKRKFL
jgi:hypothetical protein